MKIVPNSMAPESAHTHKIQAVSNTTHWEEATPLYQSHNLQMNPVYSSEHHKDGLFSKRS